ncbi:MAG: MarR family winged helix-turn-helix transcriptional regulator [Candidatus Dormibacteria bacterium]
MDRTRSEAVADDAGPTESSLVEKMLAIQPRIQRVLDLSMPSEMARELAGVTVHQLEALSFLPSEGVPMRTFAQGVGISGAAATALANRMIEKGLAVRRYDPDDRRTVRLAPTTGARKLVQSYREWQRQSMASMLGRLSEDQVTTLLELLAVLAPHDTPQAVP